MIYERKAPKLRIEWVLLSVVSNLCKKTVFLYTLFPCSITGINSLKKWYTPSSLKDH